MQTKKTVSKRLLLVILTIVAGCTVRMNEYVFEPGVPLSISPQESTIPAMTGGIFFATRGGHPPYEYEIIKGGGRVDPVVGYFEAPKETGEVIVRVRDQQKTYRDARIQIVEKP